MAKKNVPAAEKATCPITLERFQGKAAPLAVSIGGQVLTADVKAPFSTGSFGWYCTGKVTIEVDGVPVKVQVGCNLIAVGSKPEAK